MKIFLTGASGFLGRHLISYLEDSSHEIVAMTRSSSSDLGVTTHVGDRQNREATPMLLQVALN